MLQGAVLQQQVPATAYLPSRADPAGEKHGASVDCTKRPRAQPHKPLGGGGEIIRQQFATSAFANVTRAWGLAFISLQPLVPSRLRLGEIGFPALGAGVLRQHGGCGKRHTMKSARRPGASRCSLPDQRAGHWPPLAPHRPQTKSHFVNFVLKRYVLGRDPGKSFSNSSSTSGGGDTAAAQTIPVSLSPAVQTCDEVLLRMLLAQGWDADKTAASFSAVRNDGETAVRLLPGRRHRPTKTDFPKRCCIRMHFRITPHLLLDKGADTSVYDRRWGDAIPPRYSTRLQGGRPAPS